MPKVQNAGATDVTYDFQKFEITAKKSNSHISKRVGDLPFFFFLPFLFYYFLINSPQKLQRTPRPKGENAPGEVPEGKRQASRVRENSTVMGSEVPAEGRRGLRAIGALTVCLRKFRRKEIQMTFFFFTLFKEEQAANACLKKKKKKEGGLKELYRSLLPAEMSEVNYYCTIDCELQILCSRRQCYTRQ